jgi:hypothetical protein
VLRICYSPVYRVERMIYPGWNMVCSPDCVFPVDSIVSQPPCHLPYIYTWDPITGGYVTVTELLPGGGYWMAATCVCSLIMDCADVLLVQSTPENEIMELGEEPTWKSTVSVENQELVFGMHPSASDGFDRLLDKPLPPPPVTASDDVKKRGGKGLSGIVKAAWLILDTTFPMLRESYVKEGSQGIYELSVELPKPGKVEWSNLPEGYRCILHYGRRSVDMKGKGFLPLPAGSHSLTLLLDTFDSLPRKTEVLANYPNPFNPETWIPYRLAEDGHVTLIIRDVSGREVRRFHLGRQLAGEYVGKERAIYWDGRNESGELVGSGVYFYTLQAGISITGKLVITR